MPRAVLNGVVVAESDDTIVVEGNHYFPRQSLVEEHFSPSTKHTYCPWKGQASYLTVEAGGDTAPDAAWFYPEPKPKAEELVRDRVAFWRGVRVED